MSNSIEQMSRILSGKSIPVQDVFNRPHNPPVMFIKNERGERIDAFRVRSTQRPEYSLAIPPQED